MRTQSFDLLVNDTGLTKRVMFKLGHFILERYLVEQRVVFSWLQMEGRVGEEHFYC